MATDASEVRKQHRFDEERLHEYLKENVVDFPQGSSKIEVLQYRSGQSNPTFYLKKDGRELVMRKKPPGQLLRGAHQVGREFRIQKALFSAGFPVPKPIAHCEDVSVIGTEFYIMEHVRGRIFRDIALPELSPGERKDIYFAMINTLAHLHSLDFKKLGVQGFGKEGGFCRRQINTWTKQFQGAMKIASLPEVPSATELFQWLPNNIPRNTERTTIVHGDYRLENMIFHPTKPVVIAVLDWELSTLGDPLTDLAYNCAAYYWPENMDNAMGNPLAGGSNAPVSSVPGIPSKEDYMKVYCTRLGVPYPIQDWQFYLALAYFRAASICEGVYARSKLGNASSETAETRGAAAKLLSDASLHIAKGSTSNAKRPLTSSLIEDISPALAMQPLSDRGRDLLQKVTDFVKKEIIPAEPIFEHHIKTAKDPWTIPPIMEELKAKAKSAGLWNLFLPSESGLTQLEYAYMAEQMGRSPIGPEPFNCAAPDTGNMEVLHLYGTPEQKERWLRPLLEGRIRSCYCMTEPDVASSDATNMECTFTREGDEYVINGKKWWSSGAGDPRLGVAIVMGRTGNKDSPTHKQHSMIIVPTDAPGFIKVRPLSVFGNVDAPHGHFEVRFDNVRVPASNIILGEGRGFEIAQGRLGPGRIHHCMRLLGMAERSLELMCKRAEERVAFGRKLNRMQVVQHQIAESRIEIDMARLLVLKAANMHDKYGSKKARKEIAMIKIVVPRMACQVIDRAIQVHGGGGVCDDFPLARYYTGARSLRIADGPDEVHLSSVAKMELKEQFQKSML
ncbi:acyl-CoA dehydrogenase family member 11-like isoform X2 [Lytechinus variegatus]|uniref:acyl-CoA dehydrogenase family member 11-like isoform X2 n=1 Tax=Lytechinus variegatus TaxID=7654 RepID=UPI001BB22B6A|nr:acyl-CoA dehydrogenase family member 11-like isoform X2 [Lytechinus variegatus]